MAESKWHYVSGDRTVGPIDESELCRLIVNQQLHSNVLVWKDGMQNWVRAVDVPGLIPPQIPSSSTQYSDPHSTQFTPVEHGTGAYAFKTGYQQEQYHAGHPVEQLSYAGFWKRLVALIIDSVLINLLYILFFVCALALMASTSNSNSNNYNNPDIDMISALINCSSIIVGWLYFATMESSRFQGTLGKMALGIKVVDLRGYPIGFGQATGRHFGKIISGITLGIGYIMAAFTEKKQGLHDIMANCLVVNKSR